MEVDFEVLWGDGDPCEALERGQVRAGVLYVEHMQQGGEEQLQLHLGNLVPETHPLARAEGHEVLGFGELALLCQEALGSEHLRLLPDVGVHVDTVQQRDDVGVLRDNVTLQLHRSK